MTIQFYVKSYDKQSGCYEASTRDDLTTTRIHAEENSLTDAQIEAQFRHALAQHFDVDESAIELAF